MHTIELAQAEYQWVDHLIDSWFRVNTVNGQYAWDEEAEDEEEDEEEQSEADVEAGACDSEVELRGKGTPSFRRPLIDGSGVPEPASLPLLTSVPCEPREVHAPLSPPHAAPATLPAPAYRPLLPAQLPRPLMLNAES